MATNVDLAWEALESVEDPEFGIDVVALGLIYDVAFDPIKSKLAITMTLTNAACPFAEELEAAVNEALKGLADLITIEWTFDPPWGPALMSDEGRLAWASIGGLIPSY